MLCFYHVFSFSILQVHGNPGSDGDGQIALWNDEFHMGSYQINYAVYQIYDAGTDGSIVEVYYGISNQVRSLKFMKRFDY